MYLSRNYPHKKGHIVRVVSIILGMPGVCAGADYELIILGEYVLCPNNI